MLWAFLADLKHFFLLCFAEPAVPPPVYQCTSPTSDSMSSHLASGGQYEQLELVDSPEQMDHMEYDRELDDIQNVINNDIFQYQVSNVQFPYEACKICVQFLVADCS